MDLLECKSTMNLFKFKILDTMGYLGDVTLAKDCLMYISAMQKELSSSSLGVAQCFLSY